MLTKSIKFMKRLKRNDKNANYLFIGDLNTMGMNITFANNDVSGLDELTRYEKMFDKKDMALLSKTHARTWWNGNGDEATRGSDLDHVFASSHLQFNDLDGAQISVRGWTQKTTAASKKTWISTHSDHSMIYGEVRA